MARTSNQCIVQITHKKAQSVCTDFQKCTFNPLEKKERRKKPCPLARGKRGKGNGDLVLCTSFEANRELALLLYTKVQTLGKPTE